MKLSLIFFTLSLSWIIYGKSSKENQHEKVIENKDTCFYFLKVPADIDMPETPHFDTTIVRSADCKIHILLLHSWGTFSTYNLSSEKYKRKISFSSKEKGMMDITELPEGKYAMSLMACGNGGGFTLRLK